MKITLDRELCPGALECGLCLRACPEGVLMARPEAGVAGRARPWTVVAALSHRCDGCGRCVEECPAGAIFLEG